MTRHDRPYPWCSAGGGDEQGRWLMFEVRGLRQCLRWIPPGVFYMGSPPDEPGRFDDELRHEVVITRGFWLADTACTQALWEAVMGENPSQAHGPDLPVESVSHDDCLRFIATLNGEAPHLALRLPTEAQWEYACRAGTSGSYSFGETVDRHRVNYNVFSETLAAAADPAADIVQPWTGPIGVKDLPPNAWGLYQMHGNVREWCADWYGPYPAGRVADPTGPAEGDCRVLRGGSWFSRRRGCRSAARIARRPYLGEDNYGFRLARSE